MILFRSIVNVALLLTYCIMFCSAVLADTVTLRVIGEDDQEEIFKKATVPLSENPLTLVKENVTSVVVCGGYVEKIEDLWAGKRGPLSGWVYEVNQNRPDVMPGMYQLKDGDKVVWEYLQYP